MGKDRITQLLNQLKDNQQQDIHNAASIFTVAQMAVNELERQVGSAEDDIQDAVARLPSVPPALDKAELLRRYGSYNGCRKAAKNAGIKFHKNPSWQQLIASFNYTEAIHQLIAQYLATHPEPALQGVTISVNLTNLVKSRTRRSL